MKPSQSNLRRQEVVHQPKSSEEISFIAAADAWLKILEKLKICEDDDVTKPSLKLT